MKVKTVEFEGGGLLKLEKLDGGINLVFQAKAPQLGELFRVISMNVVLTSKEAEDIVAWINEQIAEEHNE